MNQRQKYPRCGWDLLAILSCSVLPISVLAQTATPVNDQIKELQSEIRNIQKQYQTQIRPSHRRSRRGAFRALWPWSRIPQPRQLFEPYHLWRRQRCGGVLACSSKPPRYTSGFSCRQRHRSLRERGADRRDGRADRHPGTCPRDPCPRRSCRAHDQQARTSTRMPASSRLTQPRSRFTAPCRSAMAICLYNNSGCSHERPIPLASGRSPAVSGGTSQRRFREASGRRTRLYTDRSVFAGIGGPNTNEGIFMAALRYYPFAP